jgi:hypothetical protein
MEIWSNTDFPYQCLLDSNRTRAFQAAIKATVRQNDIELGFTNFNYYGFKIFAPKHDWPYYSCPDNGWLRTEFLPLSYPHLIDSIDFQRPIESRVNISAPIKAKNNGVINAVRISARAHLAKGVIIGATNALNGDKILPVEEALFTKGQIIQARVSYQMSGGLASLQVKLSEK